MTQTKVLSVFVIVAVAVMMSASSIAPAYATMKTTDEHIDGETPPFLFIDNPCGDGFVVVTLEFNDFLKIWDNNRYKFHSSSQFNLYLFPSGELVGTVPLEVINAQGNDIDGPESYNVNIGGDGECLNGTTFPVIDAIHCGATIQRDGDTIAHSVDCI